MNPFDSNDYADEENTLITASRLRMEWFCHFRDYRVASVRDVPNTGLLGGVHYRKRWILLPTGSARRSG